MPKVDDIECTPPIVEIFELKKLNGFKNLRLEAPTCVSVVVAENGTGKTTLLNALYAVLSQKLSKLYQINFTSLSIKFRGLPEFSVTKEELFPAHGNANSSAAFSEILSYGIDEKELYDYLLEIGPEADYRSIREHETYRSIYQSCPYDPPQTIRLIRRAIPALERTQVYTGFVNYITGALGDLEVLYLPTFRRIEVEHNQFKKRIRSEDHFMDLSNEPKQEDNLMWFGMSDVQDQLNFIRDRIKSETFSAYSRMSVQSLEDLLSPLNKTPEPIAAGDTKLNSQLKLVLARLGQAEGKSGAKIWDLIDSGEINKTSFNSLRAYLFQMLQIYLSTQKDEQSIEGFVEVINNYWKTSASESGSKLEKSFVFDKMSLGIDIKSPYNPDPLNLSFLSSGEKQIVSVFAKLHLQKDKHFIVLIDEPELSLSIAWQRLFMPDILSSPSCVQLIGITHSPFIFDNKLDSYAQPLHVSYEER